MAILKLAAISALGYVGYRYYQKKQEHHAAFAHGEGSGSVRNAGPASMADKPGDTWSKIDQESDESFPASDPPANY